MNKKMETVGKLSLFLATLIWGSSFFLMKNALDDIAPFYLIAIRFTVAAVILAFAFVHRLKLLDKRTVGMGIIMGVFLFVAYAFQTFGLAGTTPGKNAFLTAVYCVFVPFLYWMHTKKRPDAYHIAASILCILGIGLVSLEGSFSMVLGDVLTLICGLFFALHIIAVARFAQVRDIFVLTVIQFASAAVLGWICGFIFSGPPTAVPPDAMFSLAYLSVFATATALLLQNIGQKYTHASTAAIILSLESVFGVLFSILFYHERVSVQVAIGFSLIFLAIIVSETKLQFLKPKKDVDKI